MTDAMEVLFSYAQDWLEPPLLLSEPEYANVQRCVKEQEKRLRSMLNTEAEGSLKNFLDEQRLLLLFENQAMFRAGFRLAMELSRCKTVSRSVAFPATRAGLRAAVRPCARPRFGPSSLADRFSALL